MDTTQLNENARSYKKIFAMVEWKVEDGTPVQPIEFMSSNGICQLIFFYMYM